MVQFLSIIFFSLDFFNFCWIFQKFPFFCVTLNMLYNVQYKFLNPDNTNLLFFIGAEKSESHDQWFAVLSSRIYDLPESISGYIVYVDSTDCTLLLCSS